MKKVTIIIPNYNGKKFMKDCMDALAQQEYKDFDLICVDNGSTDGSLAYFREEYPDMQVIALDENYGFSRAVNEGIKAAQTPYVILLNNDTKPFPGYVGALVEMMDRHPNAFSCSAKMIQMYHPELIDDAGDNYTLMGWAYQRGIAHSSKKFTRAAEVFSSCAGAGIYRREVFEEIGYFDEMHFAYLEDLDVGFRARIYGYKNLYCPRAKVYHVGSGTSGSKYNDFKVRLAARNNVYLDYKNMPGFLLFFNWPILLLGYLIKIRFFEKRGFGKQYKDGLFEGLRTMKKTNKVKVTADHFKNYLDIEMRLIMGTFIYCYEYAKRQREK